MRIGFVSAWYERGAAYVTRAYLDLMQMAGNEVFVYARGGGRSSGNNTKWNEPYVTFGLELPSTQINFKHFKKWITENRIDVLFFNEQREFDILYETKSAFPNIIMGAYIDYYTAAMVKKFEIFNFLICNTQRHYSVFSWHPHCYYIPWGTDTELYTPDQWKPSDQIRFFHSAGTSTRKGTKALIETFIEHDLGRNSQLIIHTQVPFRVLTERTEDELKSNNISLVEKTVAAPGLYYTGDVYVYPTLLDGLGLTVYEALASGMPVITTDYAPMNEVIDETIGRLVKIKVVRCREDGYYWPMTEVDTESLADAMKFYITNFNRIQEFRTACRQYAVDRLEWKTRKSELEACFAISADSNVDLEKCKKLAIAEKNEKCSRVKALLLEQLPDCVRAIVYRKKNEKKIFKRT